MYRHGAAMLALVIAIAVGSFAASRLIPEGPTLTDRRQQSDLRFVLGQIRNGSDLLLRVDPSHVISLPDRAAIVSHLRELASRNLLPRHNPKDPTIPEFQWGTDPVRLYWVANGSNGILGNRSFNSSFESAVPPTAGEIVASWGAVFGTTAGTSTYLLDDPDVDDYQGQNKVGNRLASGGWSMQITR
ncbi:MAG: hypothetical protein AB1744_05855 [Candidatus Zixiibacteriota bacterium]